MKLHDLSTPCLLVEETRLARNLSRMQQRADGEGASLRPHTKTHKSVDLARRQLELGATGITVAKVAEAEVYVARRFEDVRIAYPLVGDDKYRRLLPLMEQAQISFCVDTPEGAAAASRFFHRHRTPATVLLKIDCGYGRAGVRWDDDDAVSLAAQIAELPGLELAGILTHAGHSYHGPEDGETPLAALERVAAQERDRMIEVGAKIVAAGARTDLEISIGSTPTMSVFRNRREGGHEISEIRPGNYAFYDRTQVALGSCRLEDCALTALFTVTSRHREGDGWRVLLDGGRKVLTSDTCGGGSAAPSGEYGLVLGLDSEPLPGARLSALSEEHAWVRLGPESPEVAVGERLRVLPNHSCVAVNTQDRVHLVDQEELIQVLPVSARGRVW